MIEGDDVTEAILREANERPAGDHGRHRRGHRQPGAPLFGQLVEHVAQEAEPTVIVVKTRDVPTRATFVERARRGSSLEAAEQAAPRPCAACPPRSTAGSASRRASTREFSDLKRLVELKEKRGLTISAVLPTLNEAETIGPIVRAARRELMKVVPLVDELLVIDSDSDDETRSIAEDEGARVVIHQQVLPKYGAYTRQGRGALEEPLRDQRRPGGLVRHRRSRLGPALPLRHAGSAADRAAPGLRQGLLPAAHRAGWRAHRRRWRPRHRARGAPAHQPLLPRAVGLHPAALGRVRRPPRDPRGHPLLHQLRGRDRAPHRPRRRSSASRAWARSTWRSATIATRTSRASPRWPSSSCRRS